MGCVLDSVLPEVSGLERLECSRCVDGVGDHHGRFRYRAFTDGQWMALAERDHEWATRFMDVVSESRAASFATRADRRYGVGRCRFWLRRLSGVGASGRCALRDVRSEEHTSELQSPDHLVCRLLLEKKNSSIALTSSRPVSDELIT